MTGTPGVAPRTRVDGHVARPSARKPKGRSTPGNAMFRAAAVEEEAPEDVLTHDILWGQNVHYFAAFCLEISNSQRTWRKSLEDALAFHPICLLVTLFLFLPHPPRASCAVLLSVGWESPRDPVTRVSFPSGNAAASSASSLQGRAVDPNTGSRRTSPLAREACGLAPSSRGGGHARMHTAAITHAGAHSGPLWCSPRPHSALGDLTLVAWHPPPRDRAMEAGARCQAVLREPVPARRLFAAH